jgi:hypothetical protein
VCSSLQRDQIHPGNIPEVGTTIPTLSLRIIRSTRGRQRCKKLQVAGEFVGLDLDKLLQMRDALFGLRTIALHDGLQYQCPGAA